tara:strand:+ start:542 stop:1231 length:690 start_codon:yes stop_codon:yes gene_type:complete
MATFGGPRFPGIENGLVFAVDPLNQESWTGPDSAVVNNIPPLSSTISGSIYNDTSGSLGVSGSFVFDGTDDRIGLNNDSVLDIFGGDFSVSLWFNHTNTAGSATPLLEIAGFSDKMAMTLGFTSNTGVGFAVGSTWNYNAGSGFNDGKWHNMIATRTGTTYKIYVDGVDTAFSNGSFGYNTSAPLNRIGSGKFGVVYYNGYIGPILFYNRVLTALEISQNYNQLKSRFT